MSKGLYCINCGTEIPSDALFCDNCGIDLELIKKTEENGNNKSETPPLTWKIINSWWILLTLPLGLFSWIAYLYTGYTANNKKWTYIGIIYIVYWLLFFIFAGTLPNNNILNGLFGIIWIISWFFGIGYAFKIRNEYLIRLELNKKIRKENKAKKEEILRKKLENEY